MYAYVLAAVMTANTPSDCQPLSPIAADFHRQEVITELRNMPLLQKKLIEGDVDLEFCITEQPLDAFFGVETKPFFLFLCRDEERCFTEAALHEAGHLIDDGGIRNSFRHHFIQKQSDNPLFRELMEERFLYEDALYTKKLLDTQEKISDRDKNSHLLRALYGSVIHDKRLPEQFASMFASIAENYVGPMTSKPMYFVPSPTQVSYLENLTFEGETIFQTLVKKYRDNPDVQAYWRANGFFEKDTRPKPPNQQ